MGGVRVSSVGIQHLLGVSVVGRHAQNVASLLASVVNGLDSLVGGTDSGNGGLVDTSVADLRSVYDTAKTPDNLPCREEQSCT
jgi:hypothetical protein